MTPRFFYDEIVTKNLQEFSKCRYDYRRGFNAFTSAFHMDEHLYKAAQGRFQSLSVLRNHVIVGCPEFGIVQDVANAFKHLTLNRSVGAIQKLQQVQLTGYILLEGGGRLLAEDGSALLLEDAELIINLDGGTTVSAFDTVEKLVGFWKHEFPTELA